MKKKNPAPRLQRKARKNDLGTNVVLQSGHEISYANKGESGDAAVVVTGKDAKEAKYKPLTSFAKSKLPSDVLQCCQNFRSPSPIQSQAWPFLLDSRDFIGIAKTGSGKTLAYVILAIMQVLNKRKGIRDLGFAIRARNKNTHSLFLGISAGRKVEAVERSMVAEARVLKINHFDAT
ncbi:hypothetical protein ACFX14_011398 [Malus domestica]